MDIEHVELAVNVSRDVVNEMLKLNEQKDSKKVYRCMKICSSVEISPRLHASETSALLTQVCLLMYVCVNYLHLKMYTTSKYDYKCYVTMPFKKTVKLLSW